MCSAPESEESKPGFDLFCVWKEYEAVAMHFNDLLIRLRTQSLAAVAAFATGASVLLRSGLLGPDFHWEVLTGVFSFLAVFWLAVWLLDFMYYNRLLLGAVRALVNLEAGSANNRILTIDLSTKIESTVRKPFGNWPRAVGIWLFYSLVFCLLLAGAIVSANLSVGRQPAVKKSDWKEALASIAALGGIKEGLELHLTPTSTPIPTPTATPMVAATPRRRPHAVQRPGKQRQGRVPVRPIGDRTFFVTRPSANRYSPSQLTNSPPTGTVRFSPEIPPLVRWSSTP